MHLRLLRDFENYKALTKKLTVEFPHNITIIFGPNGSGKSSICHAIKTLSSSKLEEGPIENVIHKSEQEPTFNYKMSNETESKWSKEAGIGTYKDKIKYFDSLVAMKFVSESPDAEKVVEVAPFKLETFDYLQRYVTQFKKYLSNKASEFESSFSSKGAELNLIYSAKNLDTKMYQDLQYGQTKSFMDYYDKTNQLSAEEISKIKKIEERIKTLEKSQSEEGRRQLEKELQSINKIHKIINKLNSRVKELEIDSFQSFIHNLSSMRKKQALEIESLVPDDEKIEEFKSFLKKSRDIINYEDTVSENCIFCKRELDDSSLQIIKSYYSFLESDLENRIKKLEEKIESIGLIKKNIAQYDFESALTPFPDSIKSIKDDLLGKIEQIKDYCLETPNGSKKTYKYSWNGYFNEEIAELVNIGKDLSKLLTETKTKSSTVTEEIIKIKEEKKILDQKALFVEYKDKNDSLSKTILEYSKIKGKVEEINFKTISLQITNTSKTANNELIRDEFERSFARQFMEIAHKDIKSTGVQLKTAKSSESVDINITVKGHPIKRVFSEGEQKLYSLALFFAEANFENRPILVFDDPVSSLDYNYVDSFTTKLKNFAIRNNDKQIIVFTHDWYFLKDLQDKLHSNEFEEGKNFSVFVLENCNTTFLNVEKIKDLKKRIENILNSKDDFDVKQRDDFCLNMRRLIETIINKIVFNDQRTQFKRDKMNPSMFYKYVGLKPLSREQASSFSDLYSMFCPPMHDNPSAAFKKTDKDSFIFQYEKLKNLEAELLE